MTVPETDARRALPAVAEFLASPPGEELAREFGAGVLKLELRLLLDELRGALRAGRLKSPPAGAALGTELRGRLLRLTRPIGRRAINATGILLHTGLGRAPLCDEALSALAACGQYYAVQADTETGARTLREERLERMLVELTGCEAATVVNNNAAATLLVLNTLAAGKEVVVSRGQLVEIGGSFRMPDVMAQSGVVLREVGTTNRTHLRDYAAAIGERTGALIHVHTSNYRIRGFSGTPGIQELCALGRERGLPVMDDLGSGALVPLREFGLADEPLVADSVKAGATAICFSADKLIGGPQAGLICGRGDAIERMRRNPFARMFRIGKLTHAALEATLVHFLNGDAWRRAVPLYRMLARTPEDLAAAAEALAVALRPAPGLAVSVAADLSYLGSGSAPDEGLATWTVRVAHAGVPAEKLALALRRGFPSVFARVQGEQVLFDVRTLLAGEAELLAELLPRAVGTA